MRASVPVIVKDPEVTQYKDLEPTELIDVDEDAFLDGPVSPRVAILDFDPDTGRLEPGARFVPGAGGEPGTYEIPRPIERGDVHVDRVAAAVSVFGAVHKTIDMFEEKDCLGREVAWAFGAPQLLVVPRAGTWANAFYERESRSLQFFRFERGGQTIHTGHSQDIVAHETAHALVDGVAPDLYGAVTPQSLAIHEAVADLAALFTSFRCRELVERVLVSTGGSIQQSTAFSGLAEQFAGALADSRLYLRDLFNQRSLAGADASVTADPHALSEILSGAFYSVLVRVYDELRDAYGSGRRADALVAAPEEAYVEERDEAQRAARAKSPPRRALHANAKALFVASERVKRTLLRGLDYLPPGDATFADLARAVLASDRAAHPESDRQRSYLEEEMVRRGIVADRSELDLEGIEGCPALDGLVLDDLVASDFVAYKFANENRALLRIPRGIPFEVRPRLDVTKLYWHRDGKEEVRECLFKVSWSEVEPNRARRGLPRRRRVRAGTTLAITWTDRPSVRACVTTARREEDRRATDALVRTLADAERLALGDAALGPGGRPRRGVVAAEVSGGTLRLRGVARMLHVTRGR